MLRTGSIAENQGFTHRSSFWSMPTMMPGIFGRPMMEGKTVRGASSPEKPACGSGVEIFGGAFGNGKAGGTAGADSNQKFKTTCSSGFVGLPCTCRCHCQPQELRPRPTWLTPCCVRGNRARS